MIRSLLSVLFLLAAHVSAQEFAPSIHWTGDVRVRSEVDMRDFNQRTPANTYTLLRTRFGLEGRPLEDVRVFVHVRDSRVFGQETNTLSDSRNLDLHQGYIEISNLFVKPLMLRLGRQELSYGNERMIGTVGWHNVGRVFDGGLFRVDVPAVTVDLFAMNTGETQQYTPAATPPAVRSVRDEGSDFFGSYIKVKSIPDHTVSVYVLYEWNRSLRSGYTELSRFTMGSYAGGKSDALDYEAEAAYQGGKRQGADIGAYMLTGTLGYAIEWSLLSRLAVGSELLSGSPDDSKYRSFDPAFHTGHKFYGFMDYFINIPANTLNRGLVDLLARATLNVSGTMNLNIWFHHFSYHQAVAGERALGQEIDMVLNLRYNRSVTFELGASTFLPASLMRERFGESDAALWGYLMTTVAF